MTTRHGQHQDTGADSDGWDEVAGRNLPAISTDVRTSRHDLVRLGKLLGHIDSALQAIVSLRCSADMLDGEARANAAAAHELIGQVDLAIRLAIAKATAP